MIRELLIKNGVGARSVFTHRGKEVSRIEGFSDATFGFAVTLLIVSQQVPQSYRELLETMRGFYAFAVCFAILTAFWYRHYTFFRHYGLQDGYTTLLNSILLFVVLFFVFPLKFMVSALFDQILHHPKMIHLPNGMVEPALRQQDLPVALQFYLFGLATVCLIFTLLYHHALTCRDQLQLSRLEVCETQIAMAHHAFPMMICLFCSALMLYQHDHPHVSVTLSLGLAAIMSIPFYHLLVNRWRKRYLARLPIETLEAVIEVRD